MLATNQMLLRTHAFTHKSFHNLSIAHIFSIEYAIEQRLRRGALSRRNFYTETLLHTKAFTAGTSTHRRVTYRSSHAFTQKSLYGKKPLPTDAKRGFCTQHSSCTKTPLQTEAVAQRRFKAEKFFRKEVFADRGFYRENPLRGEAFAQRSFRTNNFWTEHLYAQELLHIKACSQRSFYTETSLHWAAFAHRSLHTGTPIHTEAFAQRQLLHTVAFTHKSLLQNLHSDFGQTNSSLWQRIFCTQNSLHIAAFTRKRL